MQTLKETIQKMKSPDRYWEEKLRTLFLELEDMKKQVLITLKKEINDIRQEAIFTNLEPAKKLAEDTAKNEILDFKTNVDIKIRSVIAKIDEKTESAFKKIDDETTVTIDKLTNYINAITDELNNSISENKNIQISEFNGIKSQIERLRGPQGEKGEDGKNIDPMTVVPLVIAKIEKETPNNVVEKINKASEKIQPSMIAGLIQELQEIKRVVRDKKGGGGGGGGMGMPIHKTFTGNGVLTSFTLDSKVAADGNAIWLRYQGQTLDLDSQYTVSGRTITTTFTPENNSTISVTYFRA